MKSKLKLLMLPAMAGLCFAQEESAGKNELALGLGGIPALSRSNAPGLDAGSGVALQVNYGRQFLSFRKVAILSCCDGIKGKGASNDKRHNRRSGIRIRR
jgi:hypothetical protein